MKPLIAVLAVALVMFGSVQPAGASTASNCAYQLAPVSQEPDGTLATPVLIGCYATYSEALAAGSDGAIEVAAATRPASLTDATLTGATSTASASSSVLIGTEWATSGYTGPSSSYFAPSTCSSTQTWDVSYVGDTWNDRFNSGKGFGGCDTNKKFRDSNFGGTVLTCTPTCSDYGALDNEVSSLKWKP